jgi:hypothetical protein
MEDHRGGDVAEEQRVVTTLLRDPDAWAYVSRILSADMFVDPEARIVFGAIAAARRRLEAGHLPQALAVCLEDVARGGLPLQPWTRRLAPLAPVDLVEVAWGIASRWVERTLPGLSRLEDEELAALLDALGEEVVRRRSRWDGAQEGRPAAS